MSNEKPHLETTQAVTIDGSRASYSMVVNRMDMNPSDGRLEANALGAAMPETLFHCHARAVFAICLANTRNYHDAEDVMQAVFVKALARKSALREPQRAKAWLLQIARRECIDFHRRRKQSEPLLEEPSVPALCGNGFFNERLYEAVQELPPDYREALVLYYLDGQNCAGVAASLDVSEAAVRQRLVRARAMLHRSLQEEEPI
jgi:RNA polymerase sigma-70 factor, ECF subfamily